MVPYATPEFRDTFYMDIKALQKYKFVILIHISQNCPKITIETGDFFFTNVHWRVTQYRGLLLLYSVVLA